MSKVIAGLSEEDAITFTSRDSKITVHFNGNIEYKEIIKNEKKSIFIVPIKLVYVLCFLIEILFMLIVRSMGESNLVTFSGFIFTSVQFVNTINVFSSRNSTKRNHAAEHMVYNANRKNIELTLENVKKSPIFCEYCGSCFLGNLMLLVVLNMPLAMFTGFWIPYSFLCWFSRNLSRGIPFNPFTHLMQLGVTEKPSDFNLFISLLAMSILKDTDAVKERGEVYDNQAALVILRNDVEKLILENDFDFDTTNLTTIFDKRNGGLWPPFFLFWKI